MSEELKPVAVEKSDPAPTPIELIAERAERVADDISNKAISELRELRDQIDDTIRALQARTTNIAQGIQELAGLAGEAMAVKQICVEAFVKVTNDIKADVAALPATPPVITHQNGKRRA